MTLDPATLPDDVATLKAMLVSSAARVDDAQAEIENLKLTIAKMRRDQFGSKSEWESKLLNQLERQLVNTQASVSQDRVAGELLLPAMDAEAERHKPARRPLPGHLPRERVVHDGPHDCP